MPVRAPAATPLAAQPPAAPARPIASASAPAVASLPRPHLAEELPRPPVPEKHPAPALMAHAAPTPVATPVAERRTPSLLAAVTPPRAPIPLAPPPVQPAIGQFSAQPASASPAHPAAMGQAASVQPAYTPHSYMPIGAPVVRTMAPMQGRPPVAPASDERWVAPQAGTSMVSSLGAQRTQMAPPVPIGAHP